MDSNTIWTFTAAGSGKIKFGEGTVREAGYETKLLGGTKALIVTDEGIKSAGICDEVKAVLENSEVTTEVWDGVTSDPAVASYESCYSFAQSMDFDIVIALGGGSSIDIAKALSSLLKYGGEVKDYIRAPTGGGKKFPGAGLPTLAIPTTSGTGAEVSHSSVVGLPDENVKIGMSVQPADTIITDPLLTVTLPRKSTAATGMDALSHAIEAFESKRFDQFPMEEDPSARSMYSACPLTDEFAAKAIKLVSKYLRRAVNKPHDLKAREGMSLASLSAGLAFGNAGVTAVHAIAHTLGAFLHQPHGVTCACLLPYGMNFNSHAEPKLYAQIAKLMGNKSQKLSQQELANKASVSVYDLVDDIGLPTNLSELGLKEGDIKGIAENVAKNNEFLMSLNPRRLTIEGLETILHDALEGTLQ